MRLAPAVAGICVGQDLFLAIGRGSGLLDGAVDFWLDFRDERNGLFCDTLTFEGPACGAENSRYSSAATGMGLVIDALLTELGVWSRAEGQRRANQTLASVLASWPREAHRGFLTHFTNESFSLTAEYSTVDTAELVLGGLFAGNYFGGDVKVSAEALLAGPNWASTLDDTPSPTIFAVVDPSTGALSADLHPFNEYYTVAYLANLTDPTGVSGKFFETYFGALGQPVGGGGFPKIREFFGVDLPTDHDGFVSSFIPQFCWFLTKSFQQNPYYQRVFSDWMLADQKFWELALNGSSTVWGHPVQGRLWGCGAGDSPAGYHVEQVNSSKDMVASGAIMAGFLPAADSTQQKEILAQLQWLYDNNVCTYPRKTRRGDARVVWRCSVGQPAWRASAVDSIDFATAVLGLGSGSVAAGWFVTYAA